ncbi:MAG TPA: zinc-binding dehydrogenase [Candidatus Binatia bacterium]|jgi:NADPH2:quinone reductase
MKAIRIHRFGPEDVLQYEEAPKPSAGAGELLVKVEAAALNRADLSLRRGTYRVAPEDLPIIPGREFSGRVDAVGPGVSDFHTGQRVVGYPSKGGYAEYAVSKASLARPVPDGIEPAIAAAVPTVCLTAWFALLEDGALKPGQTVLIQAGSSGVGHVAVQLAAVLGAARVFTTGGGPQKCARLRELGAEAIDYTNRDFRQEIMKMTSARGVDVVLEMVGGDIYTKSLEVLAPGGRLVSIGGAIWPIPDKPPELTDGRKATRFSITNYLNAHPERFKQLDAFFDLILQQKLRIVIDRAFPLSETRAAQRHLEGRDHFGKIVLVMT